MPLLEWLERNNLSRAWLQKALGVSNAAISRYLVGGRIPAPDIIRKIYDLTEGEVDANSWYGLG